MNTKLPKNDPKLCERCNYHKQYANSVMAWCAFHEHDVYSKSVGCRYFDDTPIF